MHTGDRRQGLSHILSSHIRERYSPLGAFLLRMLRTATQGPLLAAPGDRDRSACALAQKIKKAQRRTLVLARSMGVASPSEQLRQAATEQTAAEAPAHELHQADSEELTTLTDQQQGLSEKKHMVSH